MRAFILRNNFIYTQGGRTVIIIAACVVLCLVVRTHIIMPLFVIFFVVVIIIIVVIVISSHQSQLDPLGYFQITQRLQANRIASVNVLVLVCRTPVDHLELFIVNQNTTSQSLRSLIVILAGGKDRKDPCTFAHGDTFSVRLVRPHDVREALFLEEIRNGLAPKTDGPAAPQRFSITRMWIDAVHFLFFGSGITPNTIGSDLLIYFIFVNIWRIDPSDLRDVEDVLDARGYGSPVARVSHGNRSRNTTMYTENILINNRHEG
mmetsp:Transcript_12169/g.28898  ORF Transcript_12169/g.28898 Transcript_12169/m.28898 type:complete len:262 (-) Transcript_12169:1191-1976(-)